ncbi:MAG: sensor histidine kinase [Pseudomonadota bacterium]
MNREIPANPGTPVQALPICVLVVTEDGFISQVAGVGQAALKRALAGVSLAAFLSVSQTETFREALCAVQQHGGLRTVRWRSRGAAFPGDLPVAGRRLARILPCAEGRAAASVAIILMHEPEVVDDDEGVGLKNRLDQMSNQLFQSEKMAAVGQLAAGVAHEINNPIGFVFSNLGTLAGYVRDLIKIVDEIETSNDMAQLRDMKSRIDYKFIREDVESLILESEDGIDRIKRIISALKDFTRQDDDVFRLADIRRGIETTLKVVNSELKYKAEVVLDLAEIPQVYCVASQINQVIMNLLVNAAHAMDSFGQITVRTGALKDMVWFEIEDNGSGIPPEIQSRIFEPFFTTKPAGKGTGLGLALSYNIVQKHGGRIDMNSTPGKGTRFRVSLPIQRPRPDSILPETQISS